MDRYHLVTIGLSKFIYTLLSLCLLLTDRNLDFGTTSPQNELLKSHIMEYLKKEQIYKKYFRTVKKNSFCINLEVSVID